MISALNTSLKQVIDETALRLSQFGFKKSGNTLRFISGNSVALVEFQKSTSNTSEKLLFTVNLAVVCGPLLDVESVPLNKAHSIDGHLRVRIGKFLLDQPDKWWRINSATDVDAIVNEVANLICDIAVPYLLRYVNTNELLALWESGQSPGLTEGARINYVASLKDILEKAWL